MRDDYLQRLMVNGWTLAGILGAIVYLIVAGFGPLDVTNVDWIYAKDDIATAQTGWTFYRYSPWEAQIALNPAYGMDFSGSILFSDAVPLYAIPFKFLSPILPETFQYFGLWTFTSFVLQGVFGWLLMSKASNNPAIRLMGAVLLLLTPLYAYRLVACTHMSLTAHWLVLGSLYLALPPQATKRPWLWWGLLVCASAFVHAYLWAMVATLWLADVARRVIFNWRERAVWLELVGVSAVLIALVMGTGVWAGPAGEFQGGFSWFKMNVFSPFDPNPWTNNILDRPGWSYILPDQQNWIGDYEGFAYAGLGGIIFAAIAAWAALPFFKTFKFSWAYAPLALVLVGMGVFAVSQNVTFGNVNFWVPWPSPLQTLGELFRATGRFIWPFYYFVFFACLFVIAKKLPVRTTLMVLAGVCAVQAADLTRGWITDSQYLRYRGAFPDPLRSAFWDQAGERYAAIRLGPRWAQHPYYLYAAHVALRHGMSTDASYLSRNDTDAQAAATARIEQAIETGEWPADTLYIVNTDVATRASATIDRSRNFIGRVDGVLVIAPGWTGCDDCGAVSWEPAP